MGALESDAPNNENMIARGFKVFHFGCGQEYRGRWLTAGTEPGFHIWKSWESAEKYAVRLGSGEIRPVHYIGGTPVTEPDGPAVVAKRMFVL